MTQRAHDTLQATMEGLTLEQYYAKQLRIRVADKKLQAFDYMKELLRMDEAMLSASGYHGRTTAQAVALALTETLREIEAMIRKFEKEHPL